MTRGLLITFSGIDGAGKSTQLERLRLRFAAQGRRCAYFWIRGGYTPGMSVAKRWARRLLGRRLAAPGDAARRNVAFRRRWVRSAWISLALVDMLLLFGVVFRLLRFAGRVVLCDRYLWDTLVDFRLLFPDEKVERRGLWRTLERWSARPDASVLLWVPEDVSRARCEAKNEPFPDPPDVRARRYRAYDAMADRVPWRRVDARASVDEVSARIEAHLQEACR